MSWYRWRNSRKPNYCNQGPPVEMMMLPTLQKPGSQGGGGKYSCLFLKAWRSFKTFPCSAGVNKAVLWCPQRGKAEPRHDSGAGGKLQEAHSCRQVQAKMGTKLEVSVGAGLLDHHGETQLMSVCLWGWGVPVFCVRGALCVGTRLLRVFESA